MTDKEGMGVKLPSPGSAEAVEMGCKCPVMDNHHGNGVPVGENDAPLFWRSSNCPIHGRQALSEHPQ